MMKTPQNSPKPGRRDNLLKMAVLESFKTNLADAANTFGLDEDEILDARKDFLVREMEIHFPVPGQEAPKRQGFLERLYNSALYELSLKVGLTLSLAGLFYGMPQLLQRFVDPLSNTIVWSGFTALYLLAFGSLGIELIFWALHNVNFRFFNRFYERGEFDYESFLRSPQLSHEEKLRHNQYKYLAYLYCFCHILSGLLGLLPNLG